jgi:hypothetical protein
MKRPPFGVAFSFGCSGLHLLQAPSPHRCRITPVHLRLPAIDHGVTSFLWAFGLGLYLWLGMLAVGVSKPTAFILAAVAAFLIFLYVRVYGEDEPRRG